MSPLAKNRIFLIMDLTEGSNIVADLTTIGRKTGMPRKVELRFLFLGGNFYATSSKLEGKHWCQNMIRNPAVEIHVKDKTFRCSAKLVSDEGLRQHVLTLRDTPPQLNRAVFEITPRP